VWENVHDTKIQTLLSVKFYIHFLRCFVFALEICIQSALREVLLMAVRGRFLSKIVTELDFSKTVTELDFSGKAQWRYAVLHFSVIAHKNRTHFVYGHNIYSIMWNLKLWHLFHDRDISAL